MAGLYGQRWFKDYGLEPSESWVMELASMTPEEAALGWKACRESGDAHCCTVPKFTMRVKEALASRRPIVPMHKTLPAPPRNVEAALATGTKEAAKKTEQVDVQRLRAALGGAAVLTSWPRRTILRGRVHPAGELSTADLVQLRAKARAERRSMWDLDLELMAYNGWTPDDEVNYEKALPHDMRTPHDKGATPFLDRWNEAVI